MLQPRIRFAVPLLAILLVFSLCFVDAGAQTRRKKRSRRVRKPVVARPVITNPVIAPPTSNDSSAAGDVKIISTADQSEPDENADTPQPKKAKTTTRSSSETEEMQQTITTLSNQVNRLNDRLSQMQENDRYLLDMERLTRAEQRAEGLRTQLIDVQTKIADLQSRLDQIEYMLKPENIDRATQGYGTVHPEEARDARRHQLERDKANVQAQLSILETSKIRLESAITNADSEVDMLRAKLNQQREQNQNEKNETRPSTPRKP